MTSAVLSDLPFPRVELEGAERVCESNVIVKALFSSEYPGCPGMVHVQARD